MTLVIVKDHDGWIFGGFTSVSWISPKPLGTGHWGQRDPHAFLFSVTNRKKFTVSDPNKAIWVRNYRGAWFGDRALALPDFCKGGKNKC